MRLNTKRLRVAVGLSGMALPWAVALLVGYIPDSISATWYTNACTVFMIILGGASYLLISYRGYSTIDDVVFTCTGVAGFGICLFPCSITSEHVKVGAFMIDNYISNVLHHVFAVAFFVLLAYSSFFLFTKSGGEMTKEKRARNVIFRVCGIGMLASFALLLVPYFPGKIWITETAALTFFGISFLTKANVFRILFCDPKNNEHKERKHGD